MKKKSMVFLTVMVLALALPVPVFANQIEITAQGYEFSAAEKEKILLVYLSPQGSLNSDMVAEVHVGVTHQSDGKHLVQVIIKDKNGKIYTGQWVYVARIPLKDAVGDAIVFTIEKRNSTLIRN